jgi:hypothetical protein
MDRVKNIKIQERGSKMNMDDRLFIGFGGILEIVEEVEGVKERRRERRINEHSKEKGTFNNPRGNPKHK